MSTSVDVLAVMASIWNRGLDEANVYEFEKARAAVAELIEVAEQIEKKSVTSTVFLSDFERLSAALARVKGGA